MTCRWAFGPRPIQIQESRTRSWTARSVLIWEIPVYTLYDLAMLGFTNHTKVPLRAATMAGFVLSGLSLLAGHRDWYDERAGRVL